jgi:hypothetical protein
VSRLREQAHLGDDVDHGPAAAVPAHVQGRVGSVNTISVYGGPVAGSAIGGTLPTHFGVTAP